jgi:hypothetical protein
MDEGDSLTKYAYNGVLSNDYDPDNNDSDPENDTLTAHKQSDPENGSVTLGSNGWFTYEPNPDFFGTDSFTYMVFDGTVYSDLTTVLIEVLADAAVQIPGDATGDGVVNGEDTARLALYWGQSDATWEMGDFNRDGVIGPADAAILSANWGYNANETSSVPEPSIVVMLLSLLVLGTLKRGRG